MKHFIILVLTGLLIITIVTAVKASTQGANLVSLENQSAKLTEQNQELKDKIISTTSLSQVSKVADKMGMVEPESFLYMNSQGIALRGANQVASLPQ